MYRFCKGRKTKRGLEQKMIYMAL